MDNIFIEWLYNKEKATNCITRLIYKIKFKLFLRKLNKIAPNFDMLVQIENFLKILELVYLYRNSPPDKLYTSIKKQVSI